MPFALVLVGLIMIVTGVKNTHREFGAAIVDDFTGDNNFALWIAAIGSVGALGYYPPLKTFSRLFMLLIVIAIVISKRGFFDRLAAGIEQGTETPKSDTPIDNSLKVGGFDLGALIASNDNSSARENFASVMNAAKLFFL